MIILPFPTSSEERNPIYIWMESIENEVDLFKIKRPKEDGDEATPKTECMHSFSDCSSCQRVKRVLLEYQKSTEMNVSSDSEVSSQKIESNSSHSAVGVIFHDNYSAVDLINDYQHIIRQHSVDDEAEQFDRCHDFMVNTDPPITCDVNDCERVRRHFSRRRDVEQQKAVDDDYRLDILRQIHSYFVHSTDTTKLNKIERAQIEEELKSIDDDNVDDVQMEEKRMELVTDKMRQRTAKMDSMAGSIASNRFCSLNGTKRDDDSKKQEDALIDEVCE